MDFLHIVWDPASDGLKLFGNFKIHYYSLMWMVAFILGYQIMKKVYSNENQSEKKIRKSLHVFSSGNHDWCPFRTCNFLPN